MNNPENYCWIFDEELEKLYFEAEFVQLEQEIKDNLSISVDMDLTRSYKKICEELLNQND